MTTTFMKQCESCKYSIRRPYCKNKEDCFGCKNCRYDGVCNCMIAIKRYDNDETYVCEYYVYDEESATDEPQ